MSTNVADLFVAKFEALSGNTIGERKAGFFKLLNEHKHLATSSPESVDEIVSRLQSKPELTFLEELFLLDVLILFRRSREIYPYLVRGNDVHIGKIAKHAWFFQEIFQSLSTEELVNDVLTTMSYTVRMKILNQLSRCLSGPKFDTIYDAVAARYGLHIAKKFFLGCSTKKIGEIMKSGHLNKKVLSSGKLKMLYKKQPQLVWQYFDVLGTVDGNHKDFMQYLYSVSPESYDIICAKYDFWVKLGKRNTRKFATLKKEEVLKKPSDFLSRIHLQCFMRKIGGKDTERLYMSCLSPRSTSYNYEIDKFLRAIPKKYDYKYRYAILQKVQNFTIVDNPECVNDVYRLMKSTPKIEERIALAKYKIKQGDDSMIKYLPIAESIPLIKDMINLTSNINKRSELINNMIHSCKINNDLDALLEVTKYFCKRHRQESVDVHKSFFQTIERFFDYEEFNEEMWTCLNELFVMYALKSHDQQKTREKFYSLQPTRFVKGTNNQQKLHYLNFLYKQENTDRKMLDELIEEFLTTQKCNHWRGKNTKNFEKYLLMFYINNSSRIYSKLDKTIVKEMTEHEFNNSIIQYIASWNKFYKDEQISLWQFPHLVSSFDALLSDPKNTPINIKNIFKKEILDLANPRREKYLKIYWQGFAHFVDAEDIHWFLRFEPTQISENHQVFLAKYFKNELYIFAQNFNARSLYAIKKLSFLHLDKMCADFCYEACKNYASAPPLKMHLQALATLQSSEEYVKLADTYTPEVTKLDVADTDELLKFKLREAIVAHFKTTGDYTTIESLLKYCTGEYLSAGLQSFTALICRTPENQIQMYLKMISGKAVSVRKHCLFVACQLCDLDTITKTFQTLSTTEKNQSILKRIFTSLIAFFVKNPQESIFEMVKSSMRFVSFNDEEARKDMVGIIGKFEPQYAGQYFQVCWEYLDKILVEQPVVKTKHHSDLIEKLIINGQAVKALQYVPTEFALEIIKTHMDFKEKNDLFSQTLAQFAYYLVINKSEKLEILTKLFSIIEQLEPKLQWDFYTEWHDSIMRSTLKKDTDTSYLDFYVNYWNKRINPVTNFDEYLKLFFVATKKDLVRVLGHDTIAVFSGKIIDFLNLLFDTYGFPILDSFIRAFERDVYRCSSNHKVDQLDLFLRMISVSPTRVVAYFVMHLIYGKDENEEKYKEFVANLRAIDDVAIKINCILKFGAE